MKINDKLESIISGWLSLRWFQHTAILMNQKGFSLVSLDKITILFGCFNQNLKKNAQTFYTFDRQTLIAGRYFKH